MKQQKELLITKSVNGIGVAGRCKKCGHPFGPDLDADTNPSRANKRMVNDFNDHTCDEDASQAAAKIVREATEDR